MFALLLQDYKDNRTWSEAQELLLIVIATVRLNAGVERQIMQMFC